MHRDYFIYNIVHANVLMAIEHPLVVCVASPCSPNCFLEVHLGRLKVSAEGIPCDNGVDLKYKRSINWNLGVATLDCDPQRDALPDSSLPIYPGLGLTLHWSFWTKKRTHLGINSEVTEDFWTHFK